MSNNNQYGKKYFEERAQYLTAIFKGKDLSFLKYPFWHHIIKRRVPSGRLLDIGCAEGALLKWAERHGYETYGLDISEFAIRQVARRELIETKLLVGDINALPFKNSCFNAITCFDVLEHIKEPLVALRELSRVLKEGGLFVASTPNIASQGLKWKGANWFGYRDRTHISLFSSDVWNKLLRESSLEVVDEFYDTLWDSPYFKRIPTLLQHLVFKPSLLVLYWTPIRFSQKRGENLWIVATKKRA